MAMNSRPLCVQPHEPEPSETGGGLPSSSCVLKSYRSYSGVNVWRSRTSAECTYDVLALVGLIGVALDGLYTTVLALDLVLVNALLVEVLPLLLVVSTSSALLSPSTLHFVSDRSLNASETICRTSLAIIIFSMTSPERYCSLE